MATKKTPVVNTPEHEQDAPSSNHAPGTSLAPASVDLTQLGSVIGNAVASGMAASAPPRRMTIGEYVRRGGINQYHPDPNVKVKFDREYYQNGHLIQMSTSYDREVELLNRITHSGRYIDRLVEVVVVQNGSEEAVDIRFSNKRDKAFELKGRARNFIDILEQIVAAQDIEREDMDDEKADRAERKAQRHARATGTAGTFGKSKATREAREKAGV
jgi:hypothetical protein